MKYARSLTVALSLITGCAQGIQNGTYLYHKNGLEVDCKVDGKEITCVYMNGETTTSLGKNLIEFTNDDGYTTVRHYVSKRDHDAKTEEMRKNHARAVDMTLREGKKIQ